MTEVDTLGQIVFVPLKQREQNCLCLLFLTIPNPTSYDDLKTYNGHKKNTFQEACAARGLLDDDTEWHNTLTEAAYLFSPPKVRDMFAFILAYSEPSEPHVLWKKHEENLCFDILREQKIELNDSIRQMALKDIDKRLKYYGRDEGLADFKTMPQLNTETTTNDIELDAFDKYRNTAEEIYEKSNQEQKRILKLIYKQIEAENSFQNNCHFIDAPAGTGKTFVLNGIAAKTMHHHKNKNSVILVASTAISAQQFKYHATTSHYAFKLPIHFMDPNTISCGLSVQDQQSLRIKQAKGLI